MPRPQPPPDAPGASLAPGASFAAGDGFAAGDSFAPGTPDAIAALERWLAAERSGVDAEGTADTAADPAAEVAAGAAAEVAAEAAAEAAFAALLAALPRPAPPPGFADRVLARARQAPRRRLLEWRALPGWDGAPGRPAVPLAAAAAVAAVAAVAAAVALLALVGLPAASGVAVAMAARLGATSIAGLLQASVEGAIAAGQWLGDVVDFGGKLVLLVRAVAEPLATPPMAALAAACLLVSVLATRCLVDLIQRDRRWVYADPI
jgi:hypothetical protein